MTATSKLRDVTEEKLLRKLGGLYSDRRDNDIRMRMFGEDSMRGAKAEWPVGTKISRSYKIVKVCRSLTERRMSSFVYICSRGEVNVAIKVARDNKSEDGTFRTVFRELLVWKELEKFLVKNSTFHLNPPLIDPKLDHRMLSFPALGFNFEELMNRFFALPIGLCLMAAADVLCALKFLHDCGYVHRNVQPRHVCVGLNEGGTQVSKVYLIDLSRADRFVHFEPEPDIPSISFVPDPIYSSTDVLRGRPHTRRDDLLSWIYTVLAFRHCHFWRRYVGGEATKSKDELGEDRLLIGYGATVGPTLCAILAYLRQLNPTRKPDYGFIMQCIISGLKSFCSDNLPPSLPEKMIHAWRMDEFKNPKKDTFAGRLKVVNNDAYFNFLDEYPCQVRSGPAQKKVDEWFEQMNTDLYTEVYKKIVDRTVIPKEFPDFIRDNYVRPEPQNRTNGSMEIDAGNTPIPSPNSRAVSTVHSRPRPQLEGTSEESDFQSQTSAQSFSSEHSKKRKKKGKKVPSKPRR